MEFIKAIHVFCDIHTPLQFYGLNITNSSSRCLSRYWTKNGYHVPGCVPRAHRVQLGQDRPVSLYPPCGDRPMTSLYSLIKPPISSISPLKKSEPWVCCGWQTTAILLRSSFYDRLPWSPCANGLQFFSLEMLALRSDL